jgi:hypothetical protein
MSKPYKYVCHYCTNEEDDEPTLELYGSIMSHSCGRNVMAQQLEAAIKHEQHYPVVWYKCPGGLEPDDFLAHFFTLNSVLLGSTA